MTLRLLFWFDLFLEARVEILTKFLLVFWSIWSGSHLKTPKGHFEINWPLVDSIEAFLAFSSSFWLFLVSFDFLRFKTLAFFAAYKKKWNQVNFLSLFIEFMKIIYLSIFIKQCYNSLLKTSKKNQGPIVARLSLRVVHKLRLQEEGAR